MAQGQKQMFDIQPVKGDIDVALSNEEQRKWTEKQWENHVANRLMCYDRTRSHLNFEVRDGKVQEIDRSMTIQERMDESLRSRNIKNPNKTPNRQGKLPDKPRLVAAMISIGGNRERMHELAYGEYGLVDLRKGADNSGIVRKKEIEDWAVDSYNFCCRKFGKDNVISFIVHLDETNPHAQAVIVPVAEVKGKDRISWNKVFGGAGRKEENSYSKLHSEYANEVSQKWGMERGDPISETGARNRSIEEYRHELTQNVREMEKKQRKLFDEIKKLETKQKSFITMLNNLQLQKENIETEIGLLKKQFGDGEITNEELAQKLERLNLKMENIDEKIALREKQLEGTKKELEEYKEKVEDAKEHLERTENKQRILWAENEELAQKLSFKYKAFTSFGLQQELFIAIEKLMPTFDSQQEEIFNNSFIGENLYNLPNVTKYAMYLMAGYVDLAMQMGDSSGGGGENNQGWRKKDDEDEAHWARRCMHGAARILNTPKRNIGMKR